VRINCIPVEYLTDQHLRAEWVEMLMLPAFMKRTLKAKGYIDIDESIVYKLNTGHAKFFYNKLKYVENRYKQIQTEMRSRGFEANPSLDLSMFPKELFNSWKPSKEDMKVNANRILTRISEKPLWYTFFQLEEKNTGYQFEK
jgi:deoxyribonuclease (pyrimidine dimer)